LAGFAVRQINVSLALNSSAQQASTGSTLTISNLRVEATINKANVPGSAAAQVRIYGLTLDHINQFTYAGTSYLASAFNALTLQAGDPISGMATVYKGQVRYAYPEFRDPKSSCLFIDAFAGGGLQQPNSPVSFKGAVNIAQVFTTLANNANLSLENNGVTGVFYNPYFWGTHWQQISKCTKAAGCYSYYSAETNKLAIWSQTGVRAQEQIYTIYPGTGMIGYPSFQQFQIISRTQFDPSIQFTEPGFQVEIQSQLTGANGKWTIFTVDYLLSSQTEGGPWEMMLTGWPEKIRQTQVSGGNS
jgi:Baseplate hub gp41